MLEQNKRTKTVFIALPCPFTFSQFSNCVRITTTAATTTAKVKAITTITSKVETTTTSAKIEATTTTPSKVETPTATTTITSC